MATPVVSAIAQRLPKEEILEGAQKLFRPMMTEFNKSAAGQSLMKVIKEDYIPTYHKAVQSLTDIATKTGGVTPPTKISSQARNIARVSAFGSNDALAVAHIKAASVDPRMNAAQRAFHAQNLADHVAMLLHDNVEKASGWKKEIDPATGKKISKPIGKVNISTFKQNVTKSKKNAVNINIDPVYHPPGKVEHMFMNYGSTVLAPAIAVPHIGTLLNYAISSPMKDLAKGLAGMVGSGNYANAKDLAVRSGALGANALDAYRVLYEGRNGIVAQVSGKPGFGEIVNKISHQPGMNALRRFQIALGASIGKNTAQDMAHALIQSGGKDKRAVYELERMGIKAADVLAQKGLSHAQLEAGIFHFVDSKVFLDSSLHRSYYSGANPYMRLGGMFHTYVARQGQLMREELYKTVKTGDYIHLVPQLAAVLGVVFPMTGLLLKNAEMLARGQFQDTDVKGDLGRLTGREGTKAAIYEYLDDFSHLGAFGVATSYIRGASRNLLANAMIGPIGNVAARGIQDAGALIVNKKHPVEPLVRDAVEDTMPDNLGKIITHQLLPTKTEEKKRHPKLKFPRMKGMSAPRFH